MVLFVLNFVSPFSFLFFGNGSLFGWEWKYLQHTVGDMRICFFDELLNCVCQMWKVVLKKAEDDMKLFGFSSS